MDHATSAGAGALGARIGAQSAVSRPLRCQWCSQTLPAGVTDCPTCGSLGAPDPRLNMPGEGPTPALDASSAVMASNAQVALGEGAALPEWWLDDDDAGASHKPTMTLADVEQRRARALVTIGAAVVLCVALGWLLGPQLAGGFERLTGSPVENPDDLRGTGAFLGMLTGMFVGATGGWLIWSSK